MTAAELRALSDEEIAEKIATDVLGIRGGLRAFTGTFDPVNDLARAEALLCGKHWHRELFLDLTENAIRVCWRRMNLVLSSLAIDAHKHPLGRVVCEGLLVGITIREMDRENEDEPSDPGTGGGGGQ